MPNATGIDDLHRKVDAAKLDGCLCFGIGTIVREDY